MQDRQFSVMVKVIATKIRMKSTFIRKFLERSKHEIFRHSLWTRKAAFLSKIEVNNRTYYEMKGNDLRSPVQNLQSSHGAVA